MNRIHSKISKLMMLLKAYITKESLDGKSYFKKAAPIFVVRFVGDIFASFLLIDVGNPFAMTFLWNAYLKVFSPALGLLLLVYLISRCRNVFLGRSIYSISLLLYLIQVSIPFTDILVFFLACTINSAQYSKQKTVKYLDEFDAWVEDSLPDVRSSRSKN